MRNQFTQLFLERKLALPTDVVESSSLPVITGLLQISDMIAPLAREPVRPYCIAGALEPLPFELDLKLGPASAANSLTLISSAPFVMNTEAGLNQAVRCSTIKAKGWVIGYSFEQRNHDRGAELEGLVC